MLNILKYLWHKSSNGEVAQVVAKLSLKRVVILTRLQNEVHEVEKSKIEKSQRAAQMVRLLKLLRGPIQIDI